VAAMRPDAAPDQADGLRRLLRTESGPRIVGLFAAETSLIAQASGNLACAMARRGTDTWLFDDSMANSPASAASLPVAAQLGLAPARGLAEALAGGNLAHSAETHASGLRLVRAGLPHELAAQVTVARWAPIARQLAGADWLFASARPDGHSSLALAAPERVLVVPASKDRLTEAYALMKSVHRLQPDARWHILLTGLTDARRGDLLMQAIRETTRRFLDLEPGYLGGVPQDDKLELAARAMRPVLEYAPASPAAVALRSAADSLACANRPAPEPDAASWCLRASLIARVLAAHTTTQRGSHGRRYG